MNWINDGFTPKNWEDIKRTIRNGEFIDGGDYFGAFKCGALCLDIVLRDVDDGEWFLCADGYILGENTGYGYTKKGTPYDEADGIALMHNEDADFTDVMNADYESVLKRFIQKMDEAVNNDPIWKEYANKTDLTWEMED